MDFKKYWWHITIIASLAVIIGMLATFIIQQQRIKAIVPGGGGMQPGLHQPNPNPHPVPEMHFEHHLRHELDIKDIEIEALREKRNDFHLKMQALNQQIDHAERELMQVYMEGKTDSVKIDKVKSELGQLLVEREMLRLDYMKLIREHTDESKQGKLDSLMNEMMRKNRGKHSPGTEMGKGKRMGMQPQP